MTTTETEAPPEAPPEVSQFASPHDVYGPPTTVSGTPSNGSSPKVDGANNAPGVVINVTGTPHTPPTNTATVVYAGGSPSEESRTSFTPTLASIAPTTGTIVAGSVVVTCTGTKFVTGTLVTVDGVVVPTTYVSATSVTAIVPTGTMTAGAKSVNVANGGLVSTTPKTFTVS